MTSNEQAIRDLAVEVLKSAKSGIVHDWDVEAIIAEIERVMRQRGVQVGKPPCPVCGGIKPVSGIKCICEGTNDLYVAFQGLQLLLFNMARKDEAAQQIDQSVPGGAVGQAMLDAGAKLVDLPPPVDPDIVSVLVWRDQSGYPHARENPDAEFVESIKKIAPYHKMVHIKLGQPPKDTDTQ